MMTTNEFDFVEKLNAFVALSVPKRKINEKKKKTCVRDETSK